MFNTENQSKSNDPMRDFAEMLGDMIVKSVLEKDDAPVHTMITAVMHLGSKPAELMSDSGMKITAEVVDTLKQLKTVVDRAVVKAEADMASQPADLDMTIKLPRRNLFGE